MLVRTKIVLPPPRTRRVERPRLWALLHAAIAERVVLLHAGAGYGKTTLLSEYGAHLRSRSVAVAWLALDAEDNDSPLFWRYLLAALAEAHPPLAELNDVAQDALVPTLINRLAELDAALVMLLDDYHCITNPAIHNAIRRLVEGLPPQAHLVLATRAAPPLPLHRWRARGWLVDVGTNALRCTAAETASFVRHVMGVNLTAETLQVLESRTEGWLAGLQLATLALHHAGQITHLPADQRLVMEYLLTDVLDAQTPHIQQFLLHTAILQRMNAPLCAAMLAEATLDQAATTALLIELERNNGFVVALGQGWYRYHHLFADALRERLQHTNSAMLPTLYARASAWHRDQESWNEAMLYAVAGELWHEAAALIEQIAGPLLTQGEWSGVARWCAALPPRIIEQHPMVALFNAWALTIMGQTAGVERWLRIVETCFSAEPPPAAVGWRGQVAAIRAQVAAARGDSVMAITQSELGLDLLPADDGVMRGVLATSLGATFLTLGRAKSALTVLELARRTSDDLGNTATALTALWLLAQAATECGKLHQALDQYQRVLAASPLPHLALNAHFGLADVYLEWNDVALASSHVRHVMTLAERLPTPELMIASQFIQARVAHAIGNVAATNEALRQAKSGVTDFPHSLFGIWVAALEARIALQRGNDALARRWALAVDRTLTSDDVAASRMSELLTLAHVLIRHNDRTTLDLLNQLLPIAHTTGRIRALVELHTLIATANHDQRAAKQSLATALRLARDGGLVRIFVDAGAVIHAHLRQLLVHSSDPYDQTVLAALPAATTSAQPLTEPLTPRELDVLHLLATGASNQEIADRFVLTIGTVKGHVNKLLGKLDVPSRTAAVVRARTLGLLKE